MNREVVEEYCRQKVASPGSSFYYSTLFYPAQLKQDLFALHAFGYEIESIIGECTDPGVARMKLSWWGEEIHRLFNQQARHPVTRSLSIAIVRHSIIRDQLLQFILHYEQYLNLPDWPSREQMLQFLAQGPGQLWRMSAEMCGDHTPAMVELAVTMGSLFAWFQILQHPHLLRANKTGVFSRLENYYGQIQDLGKQLEDCCRVFPAPSRHRLLHILIMAHILMQTCHNILRTRDHSPPSRRSLSPLRKLWIAWRLQRQYRKA